MLQIILTLLEKANKLAVIPITFFKLIMQVIYLNNQDL